jgi:SOS-response transcriptional repressor LexA
MEDEVRPESAKRLEQARVAKGFSTPKEAARYFGWTYETYIQHEQGTRGISRQSKKYANAFRVSEGWLLTGEGVGPDATVKRTIPIVGYVGAGAEVLPIDDHEKGAGLDEIDPPFDGLSSSTVAVRVKGNSMAPAFDEGDVLLYDRQDNGDLLHLIGKKCIVALKDKRIFVKELKRTPAGEIYLYSINAESEPLFGVEIEWAAKVKVVLKG